VRPAVLGRALSVIDYRGFRNNDPPGLVEIWNEVFTGRGAVRLRHSSPLETHAFAKPYFDPAGLIVALEEGKRVGFAHAGFGPTGNLAALSRTAGVTCLIGVRPSHQRHGIGTELLHRCEAYLSSQGAQTLFAGPMRPMNPFYFGLYGGSDLPGLLTSDAVAEPFLLHRGYHIHETCLVYQRALQQALNIVDARFAALRRRFDVQVAARTGIQSWWQECVLGPIEMIDFFLQEKGTGQMVARAAIWEMEGFSWRWNQPAVGIADLEVRADLRRQGLAKFLLAQLLRYLQDQFFGVVEVQTMERNEAALKLYQGLGFEQVDTGRIYQK
jgi:ribosomal protein S18 acetylase RimI-like enzyme